MKPAATWQSVRIEHQQITLDKGTWIQICVPIEWDGIRATKWEVVEICSLDDGTPRLRGNLPCETWASVDAAAEASAHTEKASAEKGAGK